MTDEDYDDLFELMSEPPGGHNHGRHKTEQGAWSPLETPGESPPSIKRKVSPIRHGTTYGYAKQKCRCAFCRLMWAQRARDRRV